ncbi:MAG: 2-hydroxyacyl-CoA dehydratase, partial [Oscillospiraceae bacterium]|nr:2-hydroxyacyl-CoA dehydratase [Oscillospiraceae bacterium]
MSEEIKKKPIFTKEMKETHTILIPTMLPIHFRLLSTVLGMYGYKTRLLDNSGRAVINEGLKNVHNDICYPAQLVIGQLIDALNTNTDLDLDKVALLITQTGGGCRASNYLYLLRKALDKCGYDQIPVVSATFMKTEQSPGFALPVSMILQLYYGVMCGDLIMLLNNQCLPYEVEKGATQKAVDRSIEL